MTEEMTVEKLDALCANLVEGKEYIKKCEARLKEIKEEYAELESTIIASLEKFGKTENEGEFGKVAITQRTYYKCVDPDSTNAWLRERGEYDSLAKISAATLSSHIKGIVDEQHRLYKSTKGEEGDLGWMAPGMVDSTSDYVRLKITKPKV